MRILLVEDDVHFAEALGRALRRHRFTVEHAATAAEAEAAAPADLVLLDINLPDCSGLELCRRLRATGGVPIIVLSARGSEMDRVTGLRTGADDYLVKPFGVAELLARIEAVMRRAQPDGAPAGVRVRAVGPLRVDPGRHRADIDGRDVRLTRKEFQLLLALARHPGAVVGRDQLVAQVWHSMWSGAFRSLEVHVASLRAKVAPAVRIEAVRGVGYRIVPTAARGD